MCILQKKNAFIWDAACGVEEKKSYKQGDMIMSISVSLWSRKEGEIKRFLQRYYEKEVFLDEDVEKWIYVYNKPLDSVDIISAVVDNNDQYQISMCIQLNDGDPHLITENNHNDVIKDIFELFYREPEDAAYCK